MNATEILQKHQLKCTACRAGIIEALLCSDSALTESDIKKELQNKFERTTFYRSFKTLLEHNVLHAITLHEETLYMVSGKEDKPQDSHYHFYCSICRKVLCIQPQKKEEVTVPKGFKISNAEIIIKGTCERCNN